MANDDKYHKIFIKPPELGRHSLLGWGQRLFLKKGLDQGKA